MHDETFVIVWDKVHCLCCGVLKVLASSVAFDYIRYKGILENIIFCCV